MATFKAYWQSDNRGFYEIFQARDIYEAMHKVHKYEKSMEFAERERRLVVETKQECYRYQILEERSKKEKHPRRGRQQAWDYMNGFLGV